MTGRNNKLYNELLGERLPLAKKVEAANVQIENQPEGEQDLICSFRSTLLTPYKAVMHDKPT